MNPILDELAQLSNLKTALISKSKPLKSLKILRGLLFTLYFQLIPTRVLDHQWV
jgi:hypothetical protein